MAILAPSFENHVSFEGIEAFLFVLCTLNTFENHVSFEGIEAHDPVRHPSAVFENHVSFEGIEAMIAAVFLCLGLRTM